MRSRQISFRVSWTVLSLTLATASWPPSQAGDSPDLLVVHKIKTEAFEHSRVMDHLFHLTDLNGPRLTASPGWQSAANWAANELKSFGGTNAHLEEWGPFGPGWSFSRFEMQMNQPTFVPLHGTPKAWCSGTDGIKKAPVIATPLYREDEASGSLDLQTVRERVAEYEARWKGKLSGKIILLGTERYLSQPIASDSERLEEKNLSALAKEPDLVPYPTPGWVPDQLPRDPRKRAALLRGLPLEMSMDYWIRRKLEHDKLNGFFRQEGVVAVLENVSRGAGGTLFAEAASSLSPGAPVPPPTIVLAPEHFNRLWRLAEKSIPVEVELNLQVSFSDQIKPANVIAEIPGGKKKEEIVMLGGHLDSWHAGTGATDNGAGSAVAMEAFRILKTLGLQMDRTVRIALWSGEEQGLYGSRAYVKEHFADPLVMNLKPEHARLSAYFNLDNGSGKIRGIYLQENDMARPIFEAWFSPFKDLGAGTTTIRNTGGTDHLPFDAVGLPGFQFIQDPLDYGSRTHHSELDVYDHAEPGDLMQASAIMASFVYNAATREDLIPRKPLPKPLPLKPTAP